MIKNLAAIIAAAALALTLTACKTECVPGDGCGNPAQIHHEQH